MSVSNTRDRERLEVALHHHRAGRLREAIAGYEELLRENAGNADVLQRLGVALAQSGRPDTAAGYLARSLELDPDRPTVALNLARALHELGREEEALRCCDRALALDAKLAGAYRIKSAVLAALGRREEALASIGQAVRLAPTDAASTADLGVALEQAGRLQDALACFERAVSLDPGLAPAHHNIGIVAARLGQHERALRSLDRALALQPQLAALHSNRGNALKELGRLPEALLSYATALAIEPQNPETLHNRAVVSTLLGQFADALQDYDALIARQGTPGAADLIGRGASLVALGRYEEALASLQSAIQLAPRDAQAHIQRGVALLRLARHDEAVASFDRALEIQPDLPEVLNNRGVALAALARPKDALDSFLRSLVFKGSSADTHTNVGVVLKTLGRYDEAAASFGRALWHKPDDPTASFEAAFLHLTRGEFKQGWPLYEARFRVPALAIPPRRFDAPRWNGSEALDGKVLLIHAEQGLGDSIQFSRYLSLLSAQGSVVVFEVMPSLKTLVRSLPSTVQVIGRGEPLPQIDYHCPLLSLPLAFDTQLSTIPADVPYLSAEPQRVARWSTRLQGLAGLRVGIAWQGNPNVERLIWAQGRSFPLEVLGPLADLPGVSLVSLQKGAGVEQLRDCAFRDRVFDLGPDFDQGPDAFLDTAAVMAGLDLVISSDTSVAHLAGSLGRPVWVALNAAPDWRWMLERSDSPWYPTMRLFRQSALGEWGAVVAALVEALRPLCLAGSIRRA
jgi:tetratricopeptide (TPR) repeat protein